MDQLSKENDMKVALGIVVIVLVIIALSPTVMAWGRKARDYFRTMGD